jgi:hypothetical protein
MAINTSENCFDSGQVWNSINSSGIYFYVGMFGNPSEICFGSSQVWNSINTSGIHFYIGHVWKSINTQENLFLHWSSLYFY